MKMIVVIIAHIKHFFVNHNAVNQICTTGKNCKKKITNTGRLNNMPLNNHEFTEDLKEGKAKKENTTTQNLLESVKPALWGKFRAI